MKRTCAILVSCFLLTGLTACSDAEKTATPSQEPTASAIEKPEPATFRIGDTINVGSNGDIINLTLTAARLGGECNHGTVDSVEPTTDSDGDLIQLWGEVEAEQLNNNTWTMLNDPKASTQDGFTEMISLASECAQPRDGHGDWSNDVDLGEKIRVYGAFRAPAGFEALKFENNRITREELERATKEALSPSSSVAEPADEETDNSEPYVVECLEGTPGPALWSDGSTRHSEECFQKLGGPEYLEQESQSGLQPGGAAVNGYGYAPNGARNPSSGEIQAYHGCQDGYITDPDLCAGAETAVRAADPNGELYG